MFTVSMVTTEKTFWTKLFGAVLKLCARFSGMSLRDKRTSLSGMSRNETVQERGEAAEGAE